MRLAPANPTPFKKVGASWRPTSLVGRTSARFFSRTNPWNPFPSSQGYGFMYDVRLTRSDRPCRTGSSIRSASPPPRLGTRRSARPPTPWLSSRASPPLSSPASRRSLRVLERTDTEAVGPNGPSSAGSTRDPWTGNPPRLRNPSETLSGGGGRIRDLRRFGPSARRDRRSHPRLYRALELGRRSYPRLVQRDLDSGRDGPAPTGFHSRLV